MRRSGRFCLGACAQAQPLFPLRLADLQGMVDAIGRVALAPQEVRTLPFTEGLVSAMVKDAHSHLRWGCAEPAARMSIAAACDSAGPFGGGLAAVGKQDDWGVMKYGVIDGQGRPVVPLTHEKLLAPAGELWRSESQQRTHRVFDAEGCDLTPGHTTAAAGRIGEQR